MTEVLFLNPPNIPFTRSEILIEPIDILGLATFVKSRGFSVAVRDLDAELLLGPESYLEVLNEHSPRIVVIPFDYHIPLFTNAATEEVSRMVEACLNFGAKVVLGGKQASYFPELFLKREGSLVVRGEMEAALLEICELPSWSSAELQNIKGIHYFSAGSLISTAARKAIIDLNTLPMPERALVNLAHYVDVRTMLTTRGCVQHCRFCPVHDFWGNWRERSVEHVVAEIAYLVSAYAARKILFLDDHATVKAKRMQDIALALIEADIKVTLGCLGTVCTYDRETMKLMYKAGFRWIHYGAESGSQSVLEQLRKQTTVAQIREAVLGSREAGFRVRTSWIMDAPHSTEADLEATAKLILETEPEEIRFHFMTIRAGSDYARNLGAKSMSEQYIHSSSPHSRLSAVPQAKIMEATMRLTEELSARGYNIYTDPSQFNEMDPSRGSRFAALCPGRYGVGWSLNA